MGSLLSPSQPAPKHCCGLWQQNRARLTLHQPRCTSCCSSNTSSSFPPQDLCTYCFPNLQHVFSSLFKCHLPKEVLPDQPF